MIAIEELKKKIERKYREVLQAYVLQEEVFPMQLRVSKSLPEDFSARNKLLEDLYRYSSHHNRFGYSILTEQRQTRLHGIQEVPVEIGFPDRNQYLGFIHKQAEFDRFVQDTVFILEQFPSLRSWWAAHVFLVTDYAGKWPQLLQVVRYFLQNPRPQRFAREISVPGLGTKFIEDHKTILYLLLNELLPAESIDETATGFTRFEQRFGLRTDPPRIRFRWLSSVLADRYTGGLNDLSAPVEELAACTWEVEKVVVVENKINLVNTDLYLTLPGMENAMAIFGGGRAAALLTRLPWLRHAQLFYWGDMDAEGFEILHHLMQYFPNTIPFCMDTATWQAFEKEVVAGSEALLKELPGLPPAQASLYKHICANNLRLEQERIGQEWVVKAMQQI